MVWQQEFGKSDIRTDTSVCVFHLILDEYDFLDFICERTDYSRRYYRDGNTYVITGHTPTMYINADSSSNVYIGNGHIAIDCGCIYGGKLAAYCIDDGSITYINAKEDGGNL